MYKTPSPFLRAFSVPEPVRVHTVGGMRIQPGYTYYIHWLLFYL